MASSAAVMLTAGIIGAFAVHESTQTVERLSEEISPAQIANAEFMKAMLDAETELRAYLISGKRSQLLDHGRALGRVPEARADLEEYVDRHGALARAVAAQDWLARAWLEDFVGPALAEGPTRAETDTPLFELGVRRFDAIKRINNDIADQLAGEVAMASAESETRLDLTVVLIVLVGIVGAVLCGVLGWRVTRSIRRPVRDLERVVDRLAAGDLEARSGATGPLELRRLGQAVNDLADQSARAHAVEQAIQDQMLEVDRVKSEFVANVSHELRTPLTSIAGYLELLDDELGGRLETQEADMMRVMRRNVSRLQVLIEELLDLGQAERKPDELQAVDIARLVEEVARDLRLSAGSRQVTITVDVEPAPDEPRPVVLADAAQLQRAVVNLLTNAVKFSHEGGDVRLHLEATEEEVEVTVSDSGIGIPIPDQAKVGERFYRASNAVDQQIPGTGLGLRLVQAVVSNHHGSFALSSEEGQGTTATLRLPRPRRSAPVART